MRVLVIGILSRDYVRQNWLSPLCQLFEVVYISYGVLTRFMARDYLTEYILNIAHETEFDYIFFYADGAHQIFDEDLFTQLRQTQRVLTFYPDDEPEFWFQRNKKYDHRFHFIVTHSRKGHERRTQERNYRGNVRYLPWGYNPEYYKPMLNIKKKYDVIFIGTNFYDGQGYYYDGYTRQYILAGAYQFCREKGYRFAVFGEGWEHHPILKEAQNGWVDAWRAVEVINEAKIVLGLGYCADGRAASYQTKLKHFETAGCGTFQLVNENPELRDIFQESLGYFKNQEELRAQIDYFLNHEQEREEKAGQAYMICQNQCTVQQRIQSLFGLADHYFHHIPVRKGRRREFSVKQYRVKDFGSLRDLRDALKQERHRERDVFVQIVDECAELLDFNHTLLPEDSGHYEIISVSTLLAIYRPSEYTPSFLQRRIFDPRGVLLHPDIDLTGMENSGFLKSRIMGIISDERFYPLMNYLFRMDCAAELLTAFLAQDETALQKRPRLDSGRVVSEAALVTGEAVFDEEEQRLSVLLDLCARGMLIVFYGARGFLVDKLRKLLESRADLGRYLVWADRAMAGGSFLVEKTGSSYEIVSPERLRSGCLKPEIVVIMSMYSGEEIMRELDAFGPDYLILPFYDANHANWQLLKKKLQRGEKRE